MQRRHESPIKRTNPSGKTAWVARYTNTDGKRVSAGSFALKREAQDAIDKAYDRPSSARTFGDYANTWTDRHPRSERTNRSYNHRISRVENVKVAGRSLKAWPLADLRRRHALDLIDHLLREQGRAANGVQGILRVLSAMAEDAITDEIMGVNPFRGVRVRASDPRVSKPPKPVRVFSFKQMHAFAKAAGAREPMVRVFTDTGMRLGEILPLRRTDFDGKTFRVTRTCDDRGNILEGTKTDHGEQDAGRVVPCPPSLAALLKRMPVRIDTDLLFPTPTGLVWRQRNFYRTVWKPTQTASRLDMRPHECRHSFISHLRAAGVDDADLAQIAGHTVQTMLARYTHPLEQSFDEVRRLIG